MMRSLKKYTNQKHLKKYRNKLKKINHQQKNKKIVNHKMSNLNQVKEYNKKQVEKNNLKNKSNLNQLIILKKNKSKMM